MGQTIARPKLVIGIVVDQMRWDYLYRYYDRYGAGGFKRLLNEGFSCEDTYISHLPSYTAVGHSTIFTGSVPSIDGIAGNDWIDQATGKNVYCVADSTAQPVGGSSPAGNMSRVICSRRRSRTSSCWLPTSEAGWLVSRSKTAPLSCRRVIRRRARSGSMISKVSLVPAPGICSSSPHG